MRRTALTWRALAAAGSLAAVMPTAAAIPARPQAVPALEIAGRGFGHGVGMAQDGALSMGRAGATTAQILGQFYPGTRFGRTAGNVRVPVLAAGASGTLAFPTGGEIRDVIDGEPGPGFPIQISPGGSAVISFANGRYSASITGESEGPTRASSSTTAATTTTSAPAPDPLPVSTTTTAAPASSSTTHTTQASTTPLSAPTATTTSTVARPPSAATSSRPVWAIPANGGTVSVPARSRQYRGVIEATAAAGALRFVNQVNLETYLKGMGEVRNPSWPAASLRTQAIAARTYAMRAMAAGGELCDSQRCQVYLGATAEYAAMNKAVNDTSGQALYFGSRLASTVYSANGGGFSASREEGFGTTGSNYPYLRPSPYKTTDPASWKVVAPLREIAARLAYPGTITAIDVARRGPSGRALELRLDGTQGPRLISGLAFDAGLGLRSTLFTVRVTTAVPEGALGAGSQVQALPDDAAEVSAPVLGSASLPELPTAPRSFAAARGAGDGRAIGNPLLALALVSLLGTAAIASRRVLAS